MKQSPFKIVVLLAVVVCVLLPLQWMPALQIGGYDVKRVGLLSDALPKSLLPNDTDADAALPDVPKVKPVFQDSCPKGMVCIEDFADEEERGMAPFYEALARIDELGRPVRIAYLGDSFIETDILTEALREKLQERFGGCGVGYLDIDPPYADNRTTVRQKSAGWNSFCVLDKGKYTADRLALAQRYFTPNATAWTELSGVKQARLDTTEVHTIYLQSSSPLRLGLKLDDGSMHAYSSLGNGRPEAVTATGRSHKAKWQVPASSGTVCWGVAEEGASGISVDNFSLRGSSGTTLAEASEATLKAFGEIRPYDLIVLQYGLNVANKKQKDYSHYAGQMQKIIEKLKRCFPQAGILLVSVGDREDKGSDGSLHTMPGIVALSRYQENLAADCHIAFWNLYQAMGGEGSILRMVNAKPTEAAKDYTHINIRGGKRIGNILFKTLIYGQKQYERRKAFEAQ